jgi:Mrp family chromosome partitioning ATPase
MLVIRSGQTTKQALRRARDILAQVNAQVSGVLLNAVDLSSPDYYYYYEYQGRALLPGRSSKRSETEVRFEPCA